ncbi:MAG: carboxypeptidase regulatory-like domain-containing protein [Bryobacterales bacterium]|nr:carboxypeptidase regulatory-like domain-containing protein [Bryobacterales bacterium]
MRSLRGAARFLGALFATITLGNACSIVYVPVPTGPSFQVRVEDRGRPVSGLRINLRGHNFSRTTATGANGTARFQNIPPGAYQLGAEIDSGTPDGAMITVTDSGPKNTTIPLPWSNRPPLSVQALNGILRWPTSQSAQGLSILQVELLDARTGVSRGTTQTTGDGAFNLRTPPPGLYILRVTPTDLAPEGGIRIAGIVPVEVDQRAAIVNLDLDFGWTSCGVTYVASHTCPRPELSLTALSGQVLDAAGAPIARATVRLRNSGRDVVEQLTSDEEGRFASAKQFDGNYELAVSATGFASLRQPVRAALPEDAARPQPLRIQLGIGGTCSYAAVR